MKAVASSELQSLAQELDADLRLVGTEGRHDLATEAQLVLLAILGQRLPVGTHAVGLVLWQQHGHIREVARGRVRVLHQCSDLRL